MAHESLRAVPASTERGAPALASLLVFSLLLLLPASLGLSPTLTVRWNAEVELFQLEDADEIGKSMVRNELRSALAKDGHSFWQAAKNLNSGETKVFARMRGDGKWHEYHGALHFAVFEEVEFRPNIALLHDQGRSMWLRLTNRRHSWAKGPRTTQPSTWSSLGEGKFVESVDGLALG